MFAQDIGQFIDLERYPLECPDGPRYRELLHRVRPVIGKRLRVVALFCYDRDPGMVFDQAYVDELHQTLPGPNLPGKA